MRPISLHLLTEGLPQGRYGEMIPGFVADWIGGPGRNWLCQPGGSDLSVRTLAGASVLNAWVGMGLRFS